jgi:HSP20 family protein
MAMERWRPFGSVERWDPFRGLGDIQSEVNRLFDSFSGRSTAAAVGDRMWLPAVDVHETKDDIVLSFDFPGVSEKDVQLPMVVQTDKVKASYRDGVLTVKLPKAEEVKPREIKIDLL